jgi:hypothetical protein
MKSQPVGHQTLRQADRSQIRKQGKMKSQPVGHQTLRQADRSQILKQGKMKSQPLGQETLWQAGMAQIHNLNVVLLQTGLQDNHPPPERMCQVAEVVTAPDRQEIQITVEDQNPQRAVKKAGGGNHTLLVK